MNTQSLDARTRVCSYIIIFGSKVTLSAAAGFVINVLLPYPTLLMCAPFRAVCLPPFSLSCYTTGYTCRL